VDTVTSAEELSGPGRLAAECDVTGDALTLARWIGKQRRQVTAGKVLRKADIAEAGTLLGVKVPSRVRSMADIKGLNRPWRVAVSVGLLTIEKGWAVAGPALGSWPPDPERLLDGWLAGLRAVCAAESYPQDSESVQLLVLVVLTVLGEDGQDETRHERMLAALDALTEMAELGARASSDARRASERYYDPESERPLAGLIKLLSAFGAVSGAPGEPKPTALGHWAMRRLRTDLALPALEGLPAADLIAEVSKYPDWDERTRVARDWLAARDPAEAVLELLRAGEEARPFRRTVAVGLARTLEEAGGPAWREAAQWPRTGPHAREMTDTHLTGRDWHWLVVEHAAAALEEFGPDRALTQVWLGMSGETLKEKLAATGSASHPDALGLLHALEQFTGSGVPRSIDQVAVVKVALAGVRPARWRRVEVPVIETLTTLHETIQALFGWGGDHPHVFTVGAKRYGVDGLTPGGAGDADTLTVGDAFSDGGGRIGYAYDFGANWRHELTLEKTAERAPDAAYPLCVAFRGGQPAEHQSEEEPARREPFDIDAVNRRLASLGSVL